MIFQVQVFICDCVIGNPSVLIKNYPGSGRVVISNDQSECELSVIWSQSQHSTVSFRTRKTWRWIWWLVCFLSRIFNVVLVDERQNGLIYTMQYRVWLKRREWTNMTALSVRFSFVNLYLPEFYLLRWLRVFVSFPSTVISIFLICLRSFQSLGLFM